MTGSPFSDDLTLVIGSKNFSSWSLRPWLLLKQAGIPFREVVIPLKTPQTEELVRRHSPSGYVPLLRDGELLVWDSLAICETVAERYPHLGLWPDDPGVRARARSVSAEMHSGFAELRRHLPLNCSATFPGFRVPAEAEEDVTRVLAIWRECRERWGEGGPFLFGSFTAADAMYAPVVLRFRTYGVPARGLEGEYCQALLNLPALGQWLADAGRETPPEAG